MMMASLPLNTPYTVDIMELNCPVCSTPRKDKPMIRHGDCWECGCGYAVKDSGKSLNSQTLSDAHGKNQESLHHAWRKWQW